MKYNFKTLLKEISRKNIEIGFNKGKLSYSMSEAHYSDELLGAIKKYKTQLIQHFYPLMDRSNLLSLNVKGEKIPFFLINGENANYFLKDTLGKDQPYYGFLHLGSEGEKIPFKETRIMANNFVKLLQEKKPEGPYILGGFSFGGILAFEMANILQSQGDKVELVVLFDTFNTAFKEPYLWHKNPYKLVRSNILSPIYNNVLDIYNRSISELFILTKKPIPAKFRNKYILHKYKRISLSFKPKKLDGDILLFRADDSLFVSKNLGWGGLSNSIEMVSVKGKHADFLSNPRSIEIIKDTIKTKFNRIDKKINQLKY